MSDIIITPNRGSANAPTIQFSGSANASASIRLEVLPEGQVAFLGKSGSLFSISDNMVGSLMAVGDISGLPILEVFSNDKVVMGQFNKNTLVVTGSRVGVGKSNPTVALDVSGSIAITGSMAVSGDATFAGNIAVNGTSASTMGGYLAAAKGFAATSTAGNPVITANEVLLDYSSGGRIVTVGPSAAAYNSFTIRQVDSGNANPVTAFQIDASSNATFAGSVQVANAIISSISGHAYITGPTTAGKFLTLQSGNTTGGINFRDSNSNSVGQYYQDTDAWSFAKPTTFAGAVSVGTGAAVGGATAGAGGLAFPAIAVGVADANTLDDYEEGTWTPVVSDAASGGNLATLSDAEGVYTKIGNIVYWRFNVVLTSKASASAGNTVFIQGLPFQSATIPNGWYNPCAAIIRNITFSGYVQFNVSGANSYGYFRENVSSAAGDDITFSDLTNSAAMQVSGFYKVA